MDLEFEVRNRFGTYPEREPRKYGTQDVVSIYLVASGKKPAGEMGVEADDAAVAGKLRNLGLVVAEVDFSLRNTQSRQFVYAHQKSDTDVQELARAFGAPLQDETVGRLLGYPNCCVREFCDSVMNRVNRDAYLARLLQASDEFPAFKEGGERLHGHDVLEFAPKHVPSRRRILRELQENNGRSVDHLTGIQHIPCKLFCPETMSRGYAEFLREHAGGIFQLAQDFRDSLYGEYFGQPNLQQEGS